MLELLAVQYSDLKCLSRIRRRDTRPDLAYDDFALVHSRQTDA